MHPLSKPNKYIYISFFIYCGCIFAFSLELSVDTNVLKKPRVLWCLKQKKGYIQRDVPLRDVLLQNNTETLFLKLLHSVFADFRVIILPYLLCY